MSTTEYKGLVPTGGGILVAEREVVVERLLQLLQLAADVVEARFRSRHARLLLLRDLELRDVLQDRPHDAIGAALGVLVEGRVDRVQIGPQHREVEVLAHLRPDVRLVVGREGLPHVDDGLLVPPHGGQALLDGVGLEDVGIDYRVLGVDDFRAAGAEASVLGGVRAPRQDREGRGGERGG